MSNILQKWAVYRQNGSVMEFRCTQHSLESVEAWRQANWPDADPPVLEEEDLDTNQVTLAQTIINGIASIYRYLFK